MKVKSRIFVTHFLSRFVPVMLDPAEALPLDPRDHRQIIQKILLLVEEHRANVKWGGPRTLARDPKFLPCSNPEMHCRSKFETWFGIEQ